MMVRPKKEGGPTPIAVRQAATLANLRKAGGDKVNLNLDGQAMQDLRTVMSRHGFSRRKDAVALALRNEALRSK